ncbi:sugar transferase [Fibrella aquatilis]|uniref:Sugar transferase n=1 Tax=Fibrella aquatilis TaxID=2817059 RepID=A0A939K073_9BACT|nr:sugar transferase [Fibrella aquatilis]MBO0930940.1 sugar transferase [Fibrella aquatilis]
MKHRYSVLLFPLHVFFDFVCLNASFVGAYGWAFGNIDEIAQPPYQSLWIAFNVAWAAIILLTQPYVFPRQLFKAGPLMRKLLMLTSVHMAVIALFWMLFQNVFFSRTQLLITYLLFLITAGLFRLGGLLFLQEFRARGYNSRRFVVVGYGKLAQTITRFYDVHPEMGFRFQGYFDWSTPENAGQLAGDYTQLAAFVKREGIDCVYCCMPYIDNVQLKQIVDQSERLDFQIKLLVDFRGFLTKGASVEYHDFLPVLNLSTKDLDSFRVAFLKRSFDILFSAGVLVLGSPLYVLVGLITRFASKGPVLYEQERIGQHGKPFMIYKFRSMYVDAEKAGPSLSQGLLDNRITPWGRFMRQTRIDELPQFVNVLKGDMSVVGPRPERQFFIDKIVEIAPEYTDLLKVKPGITSIGQIRFGYAATIEEMVQRLRFDLLYPKRRSLMLDLWIIAQTLRVMAQGRGR